MNRPELPGTIHLQTPGHFLEPIHAFDGGSIVGYIEHHPSKVNGQDCSGGIYIDNQPGRANWTIEQGTPENPVTLSPSLLCRTCGAHGFIRNSAWIEA